jgi:methionine synthase II (cobalamin-independent)
MPFRTDHASSLLRPTPLLAASGQRSRNESFSARFRQREDDAIRDAPEVCG